MKHLYYLSFVIITSQVFAIEYGNISVGPDMLSSKVVVGRVDSTQTITISNTSGRSLFWSIPITDPILSAAQFHNLALSAGQTVAGWGITTGWKNYGQSKIPEGLSNVVDIAAGDYHSLALLEDGTVRAWGDNMYGQTQIPSRVKNIVSISAGEYHSLALHDNGRVSAWGSNKFGQTNVPSELESVTAISAGYYHSIVLHRDGSVTGWGSNDYGQLNFPEGLDSVISISAGVAHSLALHSDGTVSAWGSNGYGQSNVPVDLDSSVVAVSAGGDHSLALLADGTVRAWGVSTGWAFFGQTQIPSGLSDVIAVHSGKTHSLALHRDYSVTAWGKNDEGQASIPDKLFLGIPRPEDIDIPEIPSWCRVTQSMGIIEPSGSVNIPVIFNGGNKNIDIYTGEVTILTNDRSNPVLTIPLMMEVYEIPFNSTPVLSEIGPQVTDEEVSVMIFLEAYDAESDFVDFLAHSLSDHVDLSIISDTLILYPADDFFGEAKITVIAGDDELIDSETITLTVNPVNDPPKCETLTISPDKPRETNDLQLTYQFVDPDNDPEGPTLVKWYKNEEIQPDLEGYRTIPGNLTDCNDSWVSLVTVHDGTVAGGLSVSNLVKIDCTPPTVSDIPLAATVVPTDVGPPSIFDNTFLSGLTLTVNLFSNNNLAYGHSLNNKDAVSMSAGLGADYRISDTWVAGGVFKKYGNLNYGVPMSTGDTTSVANGESATLFELYINKEQPFQYTRVFVGPRLSMVQWSSNEKDINTNTTDDVSKFVFYSGVDFGLIVKIMSGLSLRTNLYLGNVYNGHDHIKPGSSSLNTFCGNITARLQYDISPKLSVSGGFYNEGAPSFKGVNLNTSYSFSSRNELFTMPSAPAPVILPSLPEPVSPETIEDNSIPLAKISTEAESDTDSESVNVDLPAPGTSFPISIPVEETVSVDEEEPQPVIPDEPFLTPGERPDFDTEDDELVELDFIPGDEVISVLSEEFDIILLNSDLFEMTKEDIETVEDIVETNEGKYLVFSKESRLAEDFRKKFADAVKNGEPHFYWKNKRFSTDIK